MNGKPVEIICRACKADAMLVRTPKYDGFKKVGETLKCASCGHEYAGESEVPFKVRKKVSIFDSGDAPKQVRVFREDEKGKFCRHCVHYVVNPFVQRCTRHKKEVEATDICPDFEVKEEEEDSGQA